MSPEIEKFESDFERRVLAHVPRYWAPDATVEVATKTDKRGEPIETTHVPVEDHLREVNGYDADWALPRSINVADLNRRLVADEFMPSPEADELEQVLGALGARGYIARAGDAVSMTEAGFEALTS